MKRTRVNCTKDNRASDLEIAAIARVTPGKAPPADRLRAVLPWEPTALIERLSEGNARRQKSRLRAHMPKNKVFGAVATTRWGVTLRTI